MTAAARLAASRAGLLRARWAPQPQNPQDAQQVCGDWAANPGGAGRLLAQAWAAWQAPGSPSGRAGLLHRLADIGLAPWAQQRPLGLLAAAGVLGGVVVLARPWRWAPAAWPWLLRALWRQPW